eukprot:sb/3471778/
MLFKEGTNQISNWPELAYAGCLLPVAVIGCVCAVVTGREIMKQKNVCNTASKRNNRSSLTVVYLSLGVQAAIFLVFVQFLYSLLARDNYSYASQYFMYGNSLFCTLILSVINPIIIATRSSEFQKFYRKKVLLIQSTILATTPGEQRVGAVVSTHHKTEYVKSEVINLRLHEKRRSSI